MKSFSFGEKSIGSGYILSFRAKKIAQSPTVALRTVSLRGPAGQDWRDAFRR